MVEELANWKKILNEKTVNLQQAIKQLLDERCRTRDMMLCTYKNLYCLHEKWLENIAISEYVGNTKAYNQPIGNLNLTTTMPHSSNIIDLALVNLKLSENVSSSYEKPDISHLNTLPADTDGEKHAENVSPMLLFFLIPLMFTALSKLGFTIILTTSIVYSREFSHTLD